MQDFSATPSRQQKDSLDQVILAFEQTWQAESLPSIHSYLSDCSAEFHDQLVYELVLIDMEFRWRATASGKTIADSLGGQPVWRTYVQHIAQLGEVGQISPELLAEEYRIRQLWGDRPSQDQFMSAFPHQFPRLPKLLAAIDEELLADGATVPRVHPPGAFAIPDSRAPLQWTNFVLQEHLGSGGFGKVYRAIQKDSGQTVAIKALHKTRQHDPRAVEQFIQEALLLARLRHDGIVGMHGLGQFPGGGYFLVLDWIDGEDLQQRLKQGPIAVQAAVRIAQAVAKAIQHSHECGIIHGDLKPSNVLIGSREEVFVTDFGLAVMIPVTEGKQGPLCILGGTAAYLAPEVVCGSPATTAVDVYGLGALLITLLTGQPPWHGQSADSILAKLGTGKTPAWPAVRAEVPELLYEIGLKCMASQVENRFGTAQEVAAELSASLVSLE